MAVNTICIYNLHSASICPIFEPIVITTKPRLIIVYQRWDELLLILAHIRSKLELAWTERASSLQIFVPSQLSTHNINDMAFMEYLRCFLDTHSTNDGLHSTRRVQCTMILMEIENGISFQSQLRKLSYTPSWWHLEPHGIQRSTFAPKPCNGSALCLFCLYRRFGVSSTNSVYAVV